MTFSDAELAVLRAGDDAMGRTRAPRPVAPPAPPAARCPPKARAMWAPRPLVIECLATGAPLDRVAALLGLPPEAMPRLLRTHGLERWTTDAGALVIVSRGCWQASYQPIVERI